MVYLTLTLPLPPRSLSPNRVGHEHWRKRSAATRICRESARIYAQAALRAWTIANGPWPSGPLILESDWYMARLPGEAASPFYRPLDAGNAIGALKAFADGIVDAGLVPSDSHEWLQWGSVRLLRARSEHGARRALVVRLIIQGS